MSTQRPSSRRAILDAARALLEANGASITIEQVAQAAGVSRQAIYLHYPSRNELVLAVADDARDRAGLPSRIDALDAARTPRELLAGFVRVCGAFHPSTASAQLAMDALCRTDAELARAWTQRRVGRASSARRAVERLEASGVLATSVDRASDLLWALTGPSLFDQLMRRGWSARAYEDELSRALVAALVVHGRADARLSQGEARAKGTRDGTDERDDEAPGGPRGRMEPRRRPRIRRGVRG